MEKTWSDKAREAIAAVLSEYTKGGGDLIYLDSNDRAYLKKRIDRAYPFHQRSHFPYKVWLKERRRVFVALGIPLRSSSRKSPETGQLSLFSTVSKRSKP